MCMQMMEQRREIEADIWRETERCEDCIRTTGKITYPMLVIDLEKLFIANKRYFEDKGFYFEESLRLENGVMKYFALMKPEFPGEMAEKIRKKMKDAQMQFHMHQRTALHKRFDEAVQQTGVKSEAQILVNMAELVFENKAYFEDEGYKFEPYKLAGEADSPTYAWMKKC